MIFFLRGGLLFWGMGRGCFEIFDLVCWDRGWKCVCFVFWIICEGFVMVVGVGGCFDLV